MRSASAPLRALRRKRAARAATMCCEGSPCAASRLASTQRRAMCVSFPVLGVGIISVLCLGHAAGVIAGLSSITMIVAGSMPLCCGPAACPGPSQTNPHMHGECMYISAMWLCSFRIFCDVATILFVILALANASFGSLANASERENYQRDLWWNFALLIFILCSLVVNFFGVCVYRAASMGVDRARAEAAGLPVGGIPLQEPIAMAQPVHVPSTVTGVVSDSPADDQPVAHIGADGVVTGVRVV